MTSTRKYKQYIKLKFDIDEPIGGIIGDGYDEEAFQRLYGKVFRKAGLGFTANWAGMPTEKEVRFTKLEESYQINILRLPSIAIMMLIPSILYRKQPNKFCRTTD